MRKPLCENWRYHQFSLSSQLTALGNTQCVDPEAVFSRMPEAVVIRPDVPKARPSPDNRRGLVEPAHAFVTGDNTKHPKAFRVIDPDNDILRTAMSFGDAPCVIMLCDMRENGRQLGTESLLAGNFQEQPQTERFPKNFWSSFQRRRCGWRNCGC